MILTDNWQCSKCKKLKKQKIRVKKIKIGKQKKEVLEPDDIPKIKCCCRVMRNLSDRAFQVETEIEKSGARIKND